MSVRMSRYAPPLSLPTLVLACLACDATDDATTGSRLVEEREAIGDTTIVRVISGSEWGKPATLVEELRIGSLEGAEEDIFGQVLAIAPDGAGGAYVFDYQVPALRHYDATGGYTATIGGEGEGPGEYGSFILGLEVLDDGRIFLRDGPGAGINLYAADGEFLESWQVQASYFSTRSTTVDSLGHVFAMTRLEPPDPNRPPVVGWVHMDLSGQVLDTVPAPTYRGEPTGSTNGMFLASKAWTLDPWRRQVVGVSDRYEFEIRHPDGAVVRVVREDWSPVPVEPEERAERQAFMDWQEDRFRTASASNPGRFPDIEWVPVPDHKPAFRAFYTGSDGTIWVMLHVPGEKREEPPEPTDEDAPPPLAWTESPAFDVYRGDGTYLGRVEPPPGIRLYTFSLDTLWGVRTGDFDEQYVVRFRLVEPRRGEEVAATPDSG